MHGERAAKPKDITHDLVHESYGHVWKKVKDIDGSPGSLSKKIGWVGPLVSSRTLHHDTALRHAEAALLVPLLEDRDGFFITLRDATVLMQALSKH